MIEFFSILLVVIVMCLFLLVLFFWSGQNSAYSVFLFVLLLWMLFLVFNVSRANLDSVVSVNSSVKIYNSTGSLNNEENASVVNFVSPVSGNVKLLDTANFVWLWFAILFTVLEIVFLVFTMINFFKGSNKGGDVFEPPV